MASLHIFRTAVGRQTRPGVVRRVCGQQRCSHFRPPQTAASTPLMIELGFEVDRPSLTTLGLTIETVAAAAIGGSLDL